MSYETKASELALPGQQILPVRECGHLCCRTNDSVWSGQNLIVPCVEKAIDRQREMLERALAAYVQRCLVTVEKNPGPIQKTRAEDQDRRPMEQLVVEVLVQWLELFGFDSTGYKSAGDVLQWRLWIEDSGDWMKLCKYKLAAFYQYAQLELLEDKEMPPSPLKRLSSHPLHLLGGRAGRFLRRLIRPTAPERQTLLSSLLLVKTGMPRPGEDALLQAARKTLLALTTPRQVVWERKPVAVPGPRWSRKHATVTFTELEEQVRRTAREYFSGVRFGSRDLLAKPITPSFSANYVRSRKGLGSFGELFDNRFLDSLPVRHLRLQTVPVEEHIGLDVDPEIELSGFDAMRDQFLHTYFQSLRAAMMEPPIAQPVPLAEALKVRVITKGPPFTQFVLKPIQTFMWRVLKRHPSCELIGDPVDVEKLTRRLGNLLGDEAWCSGDYSDATNQMDPRLSNAAWETIADVCAFPRALKELGQRVLTGHLLQEDDDSELLPQTWGQLMGSIISFPILCIVNATVCRMAVEHDQDRSVSLLDARIMINGDDCLFPVTRPGYEAWKVFGKMAGLSPSVGKVYYSKKFCNVNSTTFVYEKSDDVDLSPFTRVPVIRLGLCFGLKRSLAREEREDDFQKLRLLGNGTEWDSSLGAQHRALMFECPESCKVRVHRKFLARNREVLDEATKYLMPWYIPECYGGIGLQPVGEYGPSDADRLIVGAMVHWSYWRKKGEGEPPLPVQWKGPAKTKIRQVAVEQLKKVLRRLPTKWVPQGSDECDGLDSPSLSSWVLYQRPYDVVSIADDLRTAQSSLEEIRKIRSWYLKRMDRFASMKLSRDIVPRRLVTLVNMKEKLPSYLPTTSEKSWSDVDNILMADGEEAGVKWSQPLFSWTEPGRDTTATYTPMVELKEEVPVGHGRLLLMSLSRHNADESARSARLLNYA